MALGYVIGGCTSYEGKPLTTLASTSVSCETNVDCDDPCYSVSSCVGGFCARGEADRDDDGDGRIDIACEGGTDCYDDPDPNVPQCDACYLGNAEPDVCDGFDQNCNGIVDEQPQLVWFHDADGDGTVDMADMQIACVNPSTDGDSWLAPGPQQDCDDNPRACGASCSPLVREAPDQSNCSDNFDNNCDGVMDLDDDSCLRPNQSPTAEFLPYPRVAAVGESMILDGSSSHDPEESRAALRFAWDINGDDSPDYFDEMAQHAFDAPGTYPVALTVTDSGGLQATTFHHVVVVEAAEEMLVAETVVELRAALGSTGPAVVVLAGETVFEIDSELVVYGRSAERRMIVAESGAVIRPKAGVYTEDCFQIYSGNVTLIGLELQDCPGDAIDADGNNNIIIESIIRGAGAEGIDVDGSGCTIGPGNVVERAGNTCIDVTGSANSVHGNRVEGCVYYGIQLTATGSEPQVPVWVYRNTVIQCGRNAIKISRSSNVEFAEAIVAFNTLVGAGDAGIMFRHTAPNVTSHRVHDNIARSIRGHFVETQATGVIIENNFVFMGRYDAEPCLALAFPVCDLMNVCTEQLGSCTVDSQYPNFVTDPLFENLDAMDLRLREGSPCVDAGTPREVPEDAGMQGAARDCGAVESY